MKTPSPLLAAVVALLVQGCRDEQAGPKTRPAGPQAQAQGQGRPQAAPPQGGQTLDALPTDLTFKASGSWGGGTATFLGSRLSPPNARPGQVVQVSNFFRAEKQPPQGWKFFMHIVDASGQMLANADHEIQNGAMPLESWPVGKIIEDTFPMQMPGQPVRLVMGFWQGDSRLPIDQPEFRDDQMRMKGPPIGPAEPPLPEYVAKRTKTPPTIDGDLSDPVWKTAAEVQLVGSYDGRPTSLKTTARLTWDDKQLYVAFDSADSDVWGNLLKRDDPIYTQEVVEVFLDANADLKTYNELQVSPHNVQFDAYFPARREGMDLTFDAQMKSAVKVRGTLDDNSDKDDGWSAEMAIPFARLAEVPNTPPKPGDKWRFNMYRLEHHNRKDIEGMAFSPLFIGDFHALPRFGYLTFQ